ncbi:MAG: dTDP-4-amino-4,6-dideoxygalactose transaminase [Flavobacteriales bacterium]|nr:dTDP-4-amino-4,6-dideoxygalactose transaminase [Flavobacteriales bacterium]MBK8707775.1 dTDP-4-amino-4,6-dideoxygalactose transaminase [Flavobacteriales bacterium]
MIDHKVKVTFNRSALIGRELEYIQAAVLSGQIAGDQSFSRKCEKLLENTIACSRALVTTSCTHALEMSALLLDIRAGDEVIVPAFTFVSTPNAFVLRGAKPVFCDVRADTLNMNETKLEALITRRTKAIVPVHYAGVGCEMDTILEIANRHGIPVVEDNAHGLFGKYKGRWLGTIGALATQSFHETKNITCGEGGALIVNDGQYRQRAEILREKGTNRARFFRGEVDKYSWVDQGSSYVMSDVLAAFLFGQLEQWNLVQEKRRSVWQRYDSQLQDWSRSRGINRPFVPEHCEQAWHMYYLVLPTAADRDRFIAHLADHRIKAVFHYLPLHLSEFAAQWGGGIGDCPVTESVSDRLVRLPFYTSLTEEDQDLVIRKVIEFELG